jgi:hypothetical protein
LNQGGKQASNEAASKPGKAAKPKVEAEALDHEDEDDAELKGVKKAPGSQKRGGKRQTG